MSKHATVRIGEYKIPLIGVPPDATRERCDLCGRVRYLEEIYLHSFELGNQWICVLCRIGLTQGLGALRAKSANKAANKVNLT